MKYLAFLLGIALLLTGCKKVNDKEMLISDEMDDNYKQINQLDEIPSLIKPVGIDEEKRIIQLLEKEGLEKSKENKSINEYTYLLFVNENGSIDKSMIIEGISNKYDKLLLNSLRSLKFMPGKINGRQVKFRTVLKYSPFSETGPRFSFSFKSMDSINQGEYLVKVDKMPEMLGSIEDFAKRIQYPESAKKAGIEGRVFVKALIDEKGNVISTEVVRSVSPELDAAAAKAVKDTRFSPGEKDGHQVKVQIVMPIMFKLE